MVWRRYGASGTHSILAQECCQQRRKTRLPKTDESTWSEHLLLVARLVICTSPSTPYTTLLCKGFRGILVAIILSGTLAVSVSLSSEFPLGSIASSQLGSDISTTGSNLLFLHKPADGLRPLLFLWTFIMWCCSGLNSGILSSAAPIKFFQQATLINTKLIFVIHIKIIVTLMRMLTRCLHLTINRFRFWWNSIIWWPKTAKKWVSQLTEHNF
jgi:hypothetical protein